ncbi:MAG: hypothetical protein U0235_20470 [Polyangiaceae bacterium]
MRGSHVTVTLGALAVTALSVAACDRRPRAVVEVGAECTSPYDDRTVPRRVCAKGAVCLLMLAKPGATGERTYACRTPCRSDADCGPTARCEHADSHGDEHGCVPR